MSIARDGWDRGHKSLALHKSTIQLNPKKNYNLIASMVAFIDLYKECINQATDMYVDPMVAKVHNRQQKILNKEISQHKCLISSKVSIS